MIPCMQNAIKRLMLVLLATSEVMLLLAACERNACAYVDPGSGMLIVQFLSSILGGSIFVLRRRLRQFFFPIRSVFTDTHDSETHR
jgi:hypothetical protein